jgi:hypothetical protein
MPPPDDGADGVIVHSDPAARSPDGTRQAGEPTLGPSACLPGAGTGQGRGDGIITRGSGSALAAFGAPLEALQISSADLERENQVIQLGVPPNRIDI